MTPLRAEGVAIGLGSALGAVARFLTSAGMVQALGPAFPWGTLVVNVLGSYLIGLYAGLSGPGGALPASPVTRAFVLAGFCGGFTTFSFFSLETVLLLEAGAVMTAALHVIASVVLWLLAVWAGHRAAMRWNGAPGP